MKAGEEIEYSTYPDPQTENRSHRTCIKLENIFYKMPVRQKNLEPLNESDYLYKLVTAFALLNHNITFSLLTSMHPMSYFQKSPSSLFSCEALYGPLMKNCLVKIRIPNNTKHEAEQMAPSSKSESDSKAIIFSSNARNYLKPSILKKNISKIVGYVGVMKTSAFNFNILYFNNKPVESNNDLKTYIKNEFKRLKKYIEKKDSEIKVSKFSDYELLYMLNFKVDCKKYQTIACFHADACELVNELMCHVKKILIEDIFRNIFSQDKHESCGNENFNLNKIEGMKKAAEKLMQIVEDEDLSLNKKKDTDENDENVLKNKSSNSNLKLVSKDDTINYTALKNNEAERINNNMPHTTNAREDNLTHGKSKRSDLLDYNDFSIDKSQLKNQANIFNDKFDDFSKFSPHIPSARKTIVEEHFKTPYHISDFSQLVTRENLRKKTVVCQNKIQTYKSLLRPARFMCGSSKKSTSFYEDDSTLTKTASLNQSTTYSFVALSPIIFSPFFPSSRKSFLTQNIFVSSSFHEQNLNKSQRNSQDLQTKISDPFRKHPQVNPLELQKHNITKTISQNPQKHQHDKHKEPALMAPRPSTPSNAVALMRKRTHASNHSHNVNYFIKKHKPFNWLDEENKHNNPQRQNNKTIGVATFYNNQAQNSSSTCDESNLNGTKNKESLKEKLNQAISRSDETKNGKTEVKGRVQKMMDKMFVQQVSVIVRY